MGSECLDQVGQTALLLSVYGHEVQSNLFSLDFFFFYELVSLAFILELVLIHFFQQGQT